MRPPEAFPRPLDAVKEHLRALKLGRIEAILDDALAGYAISEYDIETFLLRLFQAERADKTERLIERRIRESHLPERKTLAEFQFDFQPGLDKKLIMELASGRYSDKKQGIILAGDSGTGKSHIGKALALLGCMRGECVLYTTAAAMLSDLYSGLADNSLELKFKRYTKPTLLMIDELGFDRLEQENARNAALFFKVVDARYQRASTIYTTNIDFEALGHYLGDPVVTTAIVDRMVHHSTVITLSGSSWRLKESQELNRSVRNSPDTKPVDKPTAQEPSTPTSEKRARTKKATS